MCQKIQLRYAQLTLVLVHYQPVVGENLEELSEMVHVVFPGLGCDQDIVQVDESPRESIQDLVHEALETLGCVFQPEGHPHVFPQPERSDDCRLLDVLLCDWNLMITSDQVDF